jgi:hypothetical protein
MRRWCLLVLLAFALGAAGVLAVPASRHALLKSAGWMLVAEDPPRKADIIVISTDSLSAGVLEAGKLVDAGYASRVALFARLPSPLQVELTRRGLPHIDLQATSLELLTPWAFRPSSSFPRSWARMMKGRYCAHGALQRVSAPSFS